MVPKSRGGAEDARNRAIVCTPCNGDKGDLTLAEFRLVLKAIGDRRCEAVTIFMCRIAAEDEVEASEPALAAMRRGRSRIARRLQKAARNMRADMRAHTTAGAGPCQNIGG